MNTRKQPNRFLAMALSLCMLLTMLPMGAITAQAVDAPQVNSGISNITGYDGSYDSIYYGTWNGSPVKWRVLDDRTNTGGTGLFLLSENLLGTGDDGGVYGDTGQSWCDNFYSTNLTEQEQSAVLATTKNDEAYQSTGTNKPNFGASSLNGAKVFFLSSEEVENSDYGFVDDDSRTASYNGSKSDWLLRSFSPEGTSAGIVGSAGDLSYVFSFFALPARPAFNLDSGAVLFVSAAQSGKSTSVSSNLSAYSYTSANSGNAEWKLTIKDSSRSVFSIGTATVSGNTLTAAYSGAKTGDNEYISAIVKDASGNITYYGRLQNASSASGNVTVTLPQGFDSSVHTLYLFNERCNGDNMTDYASDFQAIPQSAYVSTQQYNVWVGGVPVTEENASDVLGEADGESATVSYDAERKTLTLNGANITSTYNSDYMGYAAILSYDELNIVLAEGSENKITLSGNEFFTGVIAMSEAGTIQNITVSGNGSLDIDITTSSAAVFGIMGNAVTIDSGAEVDVTVNGTSTNEMVSYIGIMGSSSVAIKEGSVVTATVNDNAGENIAIMSTGAVTIDNADVTAGGYTGMMGATGVSITGESTVTAKGTGYAIASQAENITWSNTLLAQGRADAQSGELEAVTTGIATAASTDHAYNTFVLSSNKESIAQYVEIKLAHSHNVCGGTDCGHEGHTAVVYTALDSNISSQILTGGNYYLTEDMTDVGSSIQITGTVNLCLNGHEISGDAEDGIFRVGEGGVLTVCDCAGNGIITETGNEEHNPIFLHSGGVLNLYSGTIQSRITAVVIDEDPDGGADSTGGMVNVYGGMVVSTGDRSQAIKVNPSMTSAAVNLYGGELTASYRGIWASSGEIHISGGEINANRYALHIDHSAASVYLSGSPVISGESADLWILPVSSAGNAVLVLHAKDDGDSVYEGDALSIEPLSLRDGYYIAQSVTGAGMVDKLSLTGEDTADYYLAYDEANSTIRMYLYTYTVTLPNEDGYTVTAQSGSASPVDKYEDYSFTVTIAHEWYKTNGFAVYANGTKLTADNNGVYTISNITQDQTVTVTGVVETEESSVKPTPSGTEGENGWYISNVTITPPDGYQISTTFNGTYGDSLTLTESVGENYTVYLRDSINGELFKGTVIGPIQIDQDKPTISVEGNTATIAQSNTVKFTVLDSISGVDKVYVRKDSGRWEDITATYQNGYTVKENGTYQFKVTDNAGLESNIQELTYANIDTQEPVVTIDAACGGETYTGGTWTNQNVTLTPNNETQNLGITTYQYRVDGGNWQDYTTPIVISTNTDADGNFYEFRAKSASGVWSDVTPITVKQDTVAPDGDIQIEENSVSKPIDEVTFGLLFKENVDVTISASDALSGAGSILYHRSGDILTEEQVAALTDADWTAYTGAIRVTAVDAEKFIYYVKVTDNAGNSIYFASNGATFDLMDPVISGVTNKGAYYTTQTVQVTDDNLDTVTLNGQAAGSQITLPGNVDTDTEYTIIATDKVGNETTVTVTMKPTAELGDALEGIEPGNVSSSDKEAIEEHLCELEELVKDETLTDAEKEIIQGLIDGAQDLLDKIDEAEQAANTGNIQQAQDITTGNVKPEDKGVLEAAKEDVEKALEDYSDNYTEDEKKQLGQTLEQIEGALDTIQRVEDVEKTIDALPERVSPDDAEVGEQIDAAKERYDALNDYEKSLVSDETTGKLNALLAQLGDYRIIWGEGSTWTKGSSEGLTFIANGVYSKFTGIEIDGKVVSPEHYTVSSGSAVITLKPAYLNTLTAGWHTIAVLYADGEAQGTFAIAEKPGEPTNTTTPVDEDTTLPKTGDDSHRLPWIILMLIAGGAVLTLSAKRRNEKA